MGGRGGGGVMAAVNRDEGVVGVMGGSVGGGVVSCVLPRRKVLASPLSNINEAKNSIMQMSCNGAQGPAGSPTTAPPCRCLRLLLQAPSFFSLTSPVSLQ